MWQVDSLGCRLGVSAEWGQEVGMRSEADGEEQFESGKSQDRVGVKTIGEKLELWGLTSLEEGVQAVPNVL